jgi:hypothetical protein
VNGPRWPRPAGASWLGVLVGASCLGSIVGCAGADRPGRAPTAAAQVAALAELAALEQRAAQPRTDRIRLRIDAPGLPAPIEARGALAVDPGRGMRLVLLGPGGTTALDFWSDGDRYRLTLPDLGTDARGDARSPRAMRRALPIELFHWWMLAPFDDELLFAVDEPGGLRAVLARRGFVTHLTWRGGGGLEAHRRWLAEGPGQPHVDEEWLRVGAFPCGPIRYEQRSTRLVVEIECEDSREGVAPRALEEPSSGQVGAAR